MSIEKIPAKLIATCDCCGAKQHSDDMTADAEAPVFEGAIKVWEPARRIEHRVDLCSGCCEVAISAIEAARIVLPLRADRRRAATTPPQEG